MVSLNLNNITLTLNAGAEIFGEVAPVISDHDRSFNVIDLSSELDISLADMKGRFKYRNTDWEKDGDTSTNADGVVFEAATTAIMATVDTKLDNKFTKWFSSGQDGGSADNAVQLVSGDGLANGAANSACNLAEFWAKYHADAVTGSPEGVAVVSNQDAIATAFAAGNGLGKQLMDQLFATAQSSDDPESGKYLVKNNDNLKSLFEQMVHAAPSRFAVNDSVVVPCPWQVGDSISFKVELSGGVTTHSTPAGANADLAVILAAGVDSTSPSVTKPYTVATGGASATTRALTMKMTLKITDGNFANNDFIANVAGTDMSSSPSGWNGATSVTLTMSNVTDTSLYNKLANHTTPKVRLTSEKTGVGLNLDGTVNSVTITDNGTSSTVVVSLTKNASQNNSTDWSSLYGKWVLVFEPTNWGSPTSGNSSVSVHGYNYNTYATQ